MFWILAGLGFGVVTALAASARGRNPAGWFFIGLFTGVFGLLAVLVMEDLSKRATAAEAAPPAPRPAPAPQPRHGDLVETYEGHKITRTAKGFRTDGREFPYLVDARRHIDRITGRFD